MRPTRVLVVGAGSGIGRAIAIAFAEGGVELALSGRTTERLEETKAACAAAEKVVVEPADISEPQDVDRLVTTVEARLGGVDVLVNTAGVHGAIGPSHECDPLEWRRAIDVNLYGSFLVSRAVVPGMLKQRSGRIILFSGGGATAPMERFSAYAASKAGVVRLTETLAQELRPHIQVNAVAPGMIDTGLLDNVLAAGGQAGSECDQVRAVRDGSRESVPVDLPVQLVLFLATEASVALTGRLISAPHDPWRDWTDDQAPHRSLYTLRRLDPHSVEPLLQARA